MPAPLHIAFALPSLIGGGSQRVVTTLANALADRGHQVDLLLTEARGPFLKRIDARVFVHSFDHERTLRTTPLLATALRRRQPDILVTASLSAYVAAYGATTWLRVRGGKPPPLCPTIHSLLGATARATSGLRSRLLLRVARATLPDARALVAVSESVARQLQRFVGGALEQVCVIHNPFNVEAIQTEARAVPLHEWFRERRPIVVAAGRLRPEKQISTLLQAMAHLPENLGARALILGEGPQRSSLESLQAKLGLAEQTAFLGFVSPPYPYIAKADLLVLPSPAEAFGNVVVEALACGTPVLATHASGGPAEILAPLESEYDPYFPARAPAALADAMARALTTPIAPRRLRRRAHEFDVSAITEQYLSLFRAVTGPASTADP
jgi:glycosyltransferase involved in cell wall biosynthesis